MKVEPIPLPSESGAQAAAATLLRWPGSGPRPAEWGAGLGGDYATLSQQTWSGSPVALAAFGAEAGTVLRPPALAAALRDRSVHAGSTIAPHVGAGAGLDVRFELPEGVSGLWVAQRRSGHQPEITRAITVATDEGVEHIRRNVRLVAREGPGGESVSEFARGVATADIVHVDTGPDERPQLHVHVLLLGAERSDGRVVAPDSSITVEPHVAQEGDAILRRALARELGKLGYALDESGRVQPPRTSYVGRDDIWVADPLDAHRPQLGRAAAAVDEMATRLGDEFAALDEAAVATRRGLADGAFTGISVDEVQERSYRETFDEARRATLQRAREDACILEGRVLESGDSPGLQLALDAQRKRVDSLAAAAKDAESSYTRFDSSSTWTAERMAMAAELVAAEREQAICQALDARRDRAVTSEPGDPPPGTKRSGSSVASVTRSHGPPREAAVRASVDEPAPPLAIRREDVPTPQSLDRLRSAIGEKRTEVFEKGMGPLKSWLAEQEAEWVLTRHAELGDPEEYLDRGGAREARRIEARQMTVSGRIAKGQEEIERNADIVAQGTSSDRARELEQLVAVEHKAIATDEQEFDRLNTAARDLRGADRHPDDWMARDGDRAKRALAYQDELIIRLELEVAQGVEGRVSADERACALRDAYCADKEVAHERVAGVADAGAEMGP